MFVGHDARVAWRGLFGDRRLKIAETEALIATAGATLASKTKRLAEPSAVLHDARPVQQIDLRLLVAAAAITSPVLPSRWPYQVKRRSGDCAPNRETTSNKSRIPCGTYWT